MQLSNDKKAALARLFRQFDSDKDGYINQLELSRLLDAINENIADEVLTLQFSIMDTNQDDRIQFRELVAWWTDYPE